MYGNEFTNGHYFLRIFELDSAWPKKADQRGAGRLDAPRPSGSDTGLSTSARIVRLYMPYLLSARRVPVSRDPPTVAPAAAAPARFLAMSRLDDFGAQPARLRARLRLPAPRDLLRGVSISSAGSSSSSSWAPSSSSSSKSSSSNSLSSDSSSSSASGAFSSSKSSSSSASGGSSSSKSSSPSASGSSKSSSSSSKSSSLSP